MLFYAPHFITFINIALILPKYLLWTKLSLFYVTAVTRAWPVTVIIMIKWYELFVFEKETVMGNVIDTHFTHWTK